MANITSHCNQRAVLREGIISTDIGPLVIHKVLFDTGALSASYISLAFFKSHRACLKPYARPERSGVRLAAKDILVPITMSLLLPVSFQDSLGKVHTASSRFYVLPDSNNPMVIGLPAILNNFGALFLDMIKSAISECAEAPLHDLSELVHYATPREGELREPWSLPLDEEAPEESFLEDPCSFTFVLNYLEVTPEKALENYFALMDTHVSEAFRTAVDVIGLLKSDAGIRTFNPANWDGANVPPVKLMFRDSLPVRLKPPARPINPRLQTNVEKEFRRLVDIGYLVPSRSPIASPMVVAPKATEPFFRICFDYRVVNMHVDVHHFPIPMVIHELQKIIGFKVFMDFDMTNAFHQFLLHEETSERLSVVTPWGQFRPRFLPEGVAPASFILQEHVKQIFADFEEWTIVAFDNLLVLAHDYNDAYKKLGLMIERCNKFNIYLKFAKTWLGFDKVLFFGYECTHRSYTLSADRKQLILDFPPPKSLKQMQSFLGSSIYFKPFVVEYAEAAAPLQDMTTLDARWTSETWTPELLAAFDAFKQRLVAALSIHYPDYNLEWVMRVDASDVAVGVVLFQVYRASADAAPVHQVIMIDSKKLSKAARGYATIKKECFSCVYGVERCKYYVRGKPFILETDHANLLYLERSEVPILIRWRAFLQSFVFVIRHIPGKLNVVADWLSRMHDADDFSPDPERPSRDPHTLVAQAIALDPAPAKMPDLFDAPRVDTSLNRPARAELLLEPPTQLIAADGALPLPEPVVAQQAASPTPESLLAQVHGGRAGHHGARKTWKRLNIRFPGHRIPYSLVEDFVASCAVCQKVRLGMTDSLEPVYRTLKSAEQRKMVGVDTLTVTPADKYGNQYLIVVVVHATKLVALYPAPDKGAMSTALALFKFFATYGLFENIISDPGSDLMSAVVAQLVSWYGMQHVFSLVDRHQSNGVEGTNKSILRHLRALVADERVQDRWSDDNVLYLVQFMLNSQVSNETGLTPFHAHFGTEANTYLRLPDNNSPSATAHEFVRLLDADLRALWSASSEYQSTLIAKRGGNADPALQNQFQPGDLVLFQRDPSKPLPNKLSTAFVGPYEVKSQYKNDVQCKHIIIGSVHTFHVERLKLYTGSRLEAERVAKLDHDQYDVEAILYYRGDPLQRTTMEFWIKFSDGDARWVTWNPDLFNSLPYEHFCRSRPELMPLIYTVEVAKSRIKEIKSAPITDVHPGLRIFVDLRTRGPCTWYDSIGLPRSAELTYVIPCSYKAWVNAGTKKKIKLFCELLKYEYTVDGYFVFAHGRTSTFNADTMILVDTALCKRYPKILPS